MQLAVAATIRTTLARFNEGLLLCFLRSLRSLVVNRVPNRKRVPKQNQIEAENILVGRFGVLFSAARQRREEFRH